MRWPLLLPVALLLSAQQPGWAAGEDGGGCDGGVCAAGRRVAVITGGNRGIGLEVVSELLSKLPSDYTVLMTGRDPAKLEAAHACLMERHYAVGSGNRCCSGERAGEQPCLFGSWMHDDARPPPVPGEGQTTPDGSPRLRTFPLDLAEAAAANSSAALAAFLRSAFGGVDILVMNAAAPSKAAAPEHIGTDHFGHLALWSASRPLLRSGGRVVYVGSVMGKLGGQFSPALRERFLDPALTMDRLSLMMREYVELRQANEHAKWGWPGSAYSVAKAANGAAARILARELEAEEDILVNACCPGPANAPHCQKGARVIVHLATLPQGAGITGRWFEDYDGRGWSGPREEPW